VVLPISPLIERRYKETSHFILRLPISMVSIIIPTYNEADYVSATLGKLAEAQGNFEVIVADGSSTDHTRERVQAMVSGFPRSLRIVKTARNRATQLNCAASAARGNTFLFLHADVMVPTTAIEAVEKSLENQSVIGGNFQIVFEGNSPVERFFTWAYRVRRPFGIYYGDSGIFVRRAVFERLKGFKPIPIMDDYEFVRRLERAGQTACLEPALLVSDRRWRVQGLFPTLVSWVWIQTLYSLGVPAEQLARWYGPVRNSRSS
jgi:rSAM/selenodomain-associated transferase 2